MNATNHAKLRYVQRIIEIPDEKESRHYLAQHEEEVIKSILGLFENAIYIWTGKVMDNRDDNNFYIHDDVILVLDQQKNSIITLYKCDFRFPKNVNQATIKGIMTEIHKLRSKEQKQREKIVNKLECKQHALEIASEQIKAAECQLEIIKQKRDAIAAEITSINSAPMFTVQEIYKNAVLLINTLDFRKDVLGLNKKVI